MVKNLPAKAGDIGSTPELGRSSGEENGNPLQYSCLGNPMDRRAWWSTIYGSQRVGHDSQQQQQSFSYSFTKSVFMDLWMDACVNKKTDSDK